MSTSGCLSSCMPKPFKIPLSVLVVIHTPTLDVLLINRADAPGTWQSVTGSRTARTRASEETAGGAGGSRHGLRDRQAHGLAAGERLRHRTTCRYGGVTRNREHVFGLCVPAGTGHAEPAGAHGLPVVDLAQGRGPLLLAVQCRSDPDAARIQGMSPHAPHYVSSPPRGVN